MSGIKGRSGAPGKSRKAGPGRHPRTLVLQAGTLVSIARVHSNEAEPATPAAEHGMVRSVQRGEQGARSVSIVLEDGSTLYITVTLDEVV